MPLRQWYTGIMV